MELATAESEAEGAARKGSPTGQWEFEQRIRECKLAEERQAAEQAAKTSRRRELLAGSKPAQAQPPVAQPPASSATQPPAPSAAPHAVAQHTTVTPGHLIAHMPTSGSLTRLDQVGSLTASVVW